jgi:hypothetical protein
MLPIALNGPRKALASCTRYARMGPTLHLRGTTDPIARAKLSFEEILSIASLARSAKHISWANCDTVNMLPIALNGPRKVLASCTQYTSMGPTLCLRGTTNSIVRAKGNP